MNRDIRKITDGAMMIALVGVVLVINRQTVGLLEDLFIWAFPLPMVFYGAKYGLKNSLTVFVSMVLLSFILSTPRTWFYVFSEELIGMIYGCGIHRKVPTRRIVITTVVTSLIATMLTTLVFASFFGYDIQAEITEIQAMMEMMMQAGGTSLESQPMDFSSLVPTVVVVGVILNGVINGLATHVLSSLMLRRLRIEVAPMQSLVEYYPPKWSGYIGLVGLIGYMYSMNGTIQNETVQNIVLGLSLCLVIYLCIFGYIAMVIFFTKLLKAKMSAIIISILLVLIGSVFVASIGFLYIVGNLHNQLLQKGE